MKLRRFWTSLKPSGSFASSAAGAGRRCDDDGNAAAGNDEGGPCGAGGGGGGGSGCSAPGQPRSLPVLQVWPSQDSPRGEADGQSFVFPASDESRRGSASALTSPSSPAAVIVPSSSAGSSAARSAGTAVPMDVAVAGASYSAGCHDRFDHENACGFEQASTFVPTSVHPSASVSSSGGRRLSTALLHPDHARLLRGPSPDLSSLEDGSLAASNSSSTASSLNSVAASGVGASAAGASCNRERGRPSEPWIMAGDRRRSSTMTARFSFLEALDLDNALRAARGSIGHYSVRSWSESLQKLTFTQSLAFPALARGLASKRPSAQLGRRRHPDPADTGLNAFAKVVTALVLVLVSVLVFFVVYKFVRT